MVGSIVTLRKRDNSALYDARNLMRHQVANKEGTIIEPRTPIRYGTGYRCPCGGKLFSEGHEPEDYVCSACAWRHWDMR